MSDLDVFRQDLAALLHRQADGRRRARSHGKLGDRDLQVAGLLDRLAHEAEALDATTIEACLDILGRDRTAQIALWRSQHLFNQIGVLYWPKDAADLIDWLTRHHVLERREQRFVVDRALGWPLGGATSTAIKGLRRRLFAPRGSRVLLMSLATDLIATFAIVAPMLSLWEVRQGVDQWLDRAAVAAHPLVPALVVSADSLGESRSIGAATQLVLDYRPAASTATCRVSVRSGFRPTPPRVGDTLMVSAPQSLCGPALIPADMGHPSATLALAAALMAAGLSCLKVWDRLSRRDLKARSSKQPQLVSVSRV